MVTKILICFGMMVLAVSNILFGQPEGPGNWIIYFGNKELDPKWNWHTELQYRNYNAIGDLEQLLLRTGIGYNINENNNNILIGYGFIHSQNYTANTRDKLNVNEHRVFQQFITRHTISMLSVQHRFRFEQRFIEDDFKLRLRYFLAFNLPLSQKSMVSKTLYFSAYNEVFLNIAENAFDRNRVYGGFGYKLNEFLRLEVGYMIQLLQKGSRDQINIVTFVNL